MTDEQGNISLIVVMTAVRVGLPLSEIPESVAIPMRWDVVTMWWRDPQDKASKFEQRVELVGPDGKLLLTNLAEFELLAADTHRHFVRIQGLPIPRRPGRCFLKLYVREDQEGAAWEEQAIYPLSVDVDLQAPKENQ